MNTTIVGGMQSMTRYAIMANGVFMGAQYARDEDHAVLLYVRAMGFKTVFEAAREVGDDVTGYMDQVRAIAQN